MLSLKDIISAMAVASLAISVQAAPAKDSLTQDVATALGVTIDNIVTLQEATDLSVIDVKIWTTSLGQAPVDVTAWDDDIKITFIQRVKAGIAEALDTTTLSKRAKGSDSAAARAQVSTSIASAKAERDSSNRRKLLQCNSGSKTACNVCAGICSAAWASGTAVCGGAALGAETVSAGGLTPAVALTLSGCIGLASAGYAACIVKCVG